MHCRRTGILQLVLAY